MLVMTFVCVGWRPVSSAERAGEHCGVLQNADVNVMPRSCSVSVGNPRHAGKGADS
jgi:hypothetical protein